jgi:hypothetical protein
MLGYYSISNDLFVGISPLDQESTALENALLLARQFYGTEFIDFEEVADSIVDEINHRVSIKARPKSILGRQTVESKILQIISGDPHENVWIPEGGDIGIPFFNAEGSNMVATLVSAASCRITYVTTIRARHLIKHTFVYPNQLATSINAQLLTANDVSVGELVPLGRVAVQCSGSASITLEAQITPDYFPLISKVAIGFVNPEKTDRCPT